MPRCHCLRQGILAEYRIIFNVFFFFFFHVRYQFFTFKLTGKIPDISGS